MQGLCFSHRLVTPATHRLCPVPVIGISTRTSSSTLSSTDAKKFEEASKHGNLVPLYRCLFSDQLTPVLAYRCLVKEDDREALSFLFESVEQSTQGRYSIVGAQPAMEIVAKENKVTVLDHEAGSSIEQFVEDPMVVPKRISDNWKPQLIDELPDTFCGGWVGFFSYDTVRYVEKKRLPFSKAPEDDRNLPDMHLGLYDDVIVFDHTEKKIYAIHWVRLDRYSSVEKAYKDGARRLENLVARVHDIESPKISPGASSLETQKFGPALNNSNMTGEAYKNIVKQAKEHILSGDILQIVLSQRFERRTFADQFEIYRSLRTVNPSPYLTYLQARGCILVASSPEILMCAKKKKIVNRPLAGTARRGKTLEEDQQLEVKLLQDEKQCAEHIMLVDLGCNDIGKVSKSGSVKVDRLMDIERYSHVMHISSTMKAIDKLEVNRRGPNSGGFGTVSFSGDMDIALALRTMVIPTAPRFETMYFYNNGNSRREWVAYLQAGAGIVADSDPDDENHECQNKAAGLARAIDLAEAAFVDVEQ
ncbi:hypothetical protein ACLB2K_074774 [Fragaria x ananassa]